MLSFIAKSVTDGKGNVLLPYGRVIDAPTRCNPNEALLTYGDVAITFPTSHICTIKGIKEEALGKKPMHVIAPSACAEPIWLFQLSRQTPSSVLAHTIMDDLNMAAAEIIAAAKEAHLLFYVGANGKWLYRKFESVM